MSNPLDWIDDELQMLSSQHLRRERRVFAGRGDVVLQYEGREFINFGSNDYLNLAGDPRLAQAVSIAMQVEGWGAGASPLVTGYTELHERLEAHIAEFEHAEAALLFSSGYAANTGTIAALVGTGDVILSDERNHASIIDGCRLSRAEVLVYRHRDVQHLAELLQTAHSARRRLIVTDSVFSMDGDLAPLVEIADMAEQFEAMLLADEAHATGVFGKQGHGLCEHLGVEDRVSVRVGTLSKALGGAGGFVVGRRFVIDWLVNRARSYVFSTAHPAAGCAAAIRALEIVRDEPWRRERLLQNAATLRDQLRQHGWNVGESESQIVPVIVGDAARTMQLAAKLQERGLLVPGIRPPSVPQNQSLLRISLTFGHSGEMIERLVQGLTDAAAC
jgi:8-amino-7-oxononanoate synthase